MPARHASITRWATRTIDSCPVNCIHYVSHEDLVTLETERLAREDNVRCHSLAHARQDTCCCRPVASARAQLDFNNYASFKQGWTGQDRFRDDDDDDGDADARWA